MLQNDGRLKPGFMMAAEYTDRYRQGEQNMSQPQSVDPIEVAKFNKLAATWWDESGPMWPLHRLNAFRIGIIEDVIRRHKQIDTDNNQPFQGLQVLDIGCGGGILSESMAKRGAVVHGVDVSEGNIATARMHANSQSLQINYEYLSAEQLVTREQRYDIVLNMEVVEHVSDLAGFMRACNTLVNPGGLQFVSTINRNPIAWLIAVFGAEYVLRWLPRGTHQYSKLVKPAQLSDLLQQDNFQILERTGVRVNPFTRQMSATKSEIVNYMFAAIKR